MAPVHAQAQRRCGAACDSGEGPFSFWFLRWVRAVWLQVSCWGKLCRRPRYTRSLPLKRRTDGFPSSGLDEEAPWPGESMVARAEPESEPSSVGPAALVCALLLRTYALPEATNYLVIKKKEKRVKENQGKRIFFFSMFFF